MAILIFTPNPFAPDKYEEKTIDKEFLYEAIGDFFALSDHKRVMVDSKCLIKINGIIQDPPNLKVQIIDSDIVEIIPAINGPVIPIVAGIIAIGIANIPTATIGWLMSMGIGLLCTGLMGLLTTMFSTEQTPTEQQSSPTYGWDGAQSIASQSYPIPFTYGRMRTAPNVIDAFVEGGIKSSKEWLPSKTRENHGGSDETTGITFTVSAESTVDDVDYVTLATEDVRGITKVKFFIKNVDLICQPTYNENPVDQCPITVRWKRSTESEWGNALVYDYCIHYRDGILIELLETDNLSFDFKFENCGAFDTRAEDHPIYIKASIVCEVFIGNTNDTNFSWLNMLCSFGHGENYALKDIEFNDQPIDTYEDSTTETVEVFYDTRMGTNTQTPIEYFEDGAAYVSGSFPYELKQKEVEGRDPADPAGSEKGSYQIISCKAFTDTVRVCLGFTGVMYYMDVTQADGGTQDNGVCIAIYWSTDKVDWTMLDTIAHPAYTETEYCNEVISDTKIGEGYNDPDSVFDLNFEIRNNKTENYYRFYSFELPQNPDSYYIKVMRVHSAFAEATTRSATVFLSNVTVYSAKAYNYPGITLLGTRILASEKLNGSPPNITAILWGRLITVPKLTIDGNTINFANCYWDSYDSTYRYFGGPMPQDVDSEMDMECTYSTTGGVVDSVTQWSDNPAWAYYDLCLNLNYGLGNKISTDQLNWSNIIDIGQWNDELITNAARYAPYPNTGTVSSTFTSDTLTFNKSYLKLGSTEAILVNKFIIIMAGDYIGQKRRIKEAAIGATNVVFTLYESWTDTPANDTDFIITSMSKRNIINVTVDTVYKAIDLMNKLFNSFRLIPVWSGYQYTLIAERERPISNFFNMGNMLSGKGYNEAINFQKPTHFTSVFVNSDIQYKRDVVEVISDAFTGLGGRETKVSVDLLGIVERWRIQKQLNFLRDKSALTSIITTEVQIDALENSVGDVVAIAHDTPEWGLSGRVSDSGSDYVIIDQQVRVQTGHTYSILVRILDTFIVKTIDTTTTLDGETDIYTDTLYITDTWDTDPYSFWSVYSFGESNYYKLYSIEDVSRTSDNTVKITMLEYDEDVYVNDTDVVRG